MAGASIYVLIFCLDVDGVAEAWENINDFTDSTNPKSTGDTLKSIAAHPARK